MKERIKLKKNLKVKSLKNEVFEVYYITTNLSLNLFQFQNINI